MNVLEILVILDLVPVDDLYVKRRNNEQPHITRLYFFSIQETWACAARCFSLRSQT